MKLTLLLLGASVLVAAVEEFKPKVKAIDRRDAISIPYVFMNAIPAISALKKRELRKPIYYAEPPAGVVQRRALEARQWGCETVGQTNCIFKGCCNPGTVCGTYGGKNGCCPIGKSCSGVATGCKATETTCGIGCCPSNAKCTTDYFGDAVCDYGLTGSTSILSSTATTSVRTPISSGAFPSPSFTCPTNYSPCAGSDDCCPAGVKCLPNSKCDSTCSPTDVRCGTGCCKDGYICNTDTYKCMDGGSGSGGSDSGGSRGASTSSSTTTTTTSASITTSAFPDVRSSHLISSPSEASKRVAEITLAGVMAILGIALL